MENERKASQSENGKKGYVIEAELVAIRLYTALSFSIQMKPWQWFFSIFCHLVGYANVKCHLICLIISIHCKDMHEVHLMNIFLPLNWHDKFTPKTDVESLYTLVRHKFISFILKLSCVTQNCKMNVKTLEQIRRSVKSCDVCTYIVYSLIILIVFLRDEDWTMQLNDIQK